MADINIQPIGLRVLVEPAEEQEKTIGGLIIPPTANEDKKPSMGKIVKLGVIYKEDDDEKFVVEVGQTVVFKKYAPEELEYDGKTYFVIDQADILAVVA